ncbi:MAG: hypothetical protein JWM11_7654 [Planctomycetaceae bacterium]|nr:hypothetical protein [Planctomycetaceae bacterium]
MNHRFADEAYKSTAAAAQRLEEGAVEMSADLQREASKWLSQLERKIIENPVLALGVALAAGLTLGLLLKRR